MAVDIERIVELSRIKLETEKKDLFKNQMEKIVSWFEEIDELSGSAAAANLKVPETPQRPDHLPPDCLKKEAALAIAPEGDGDFFIVSEVMKRQ